MFEPLESRTLLAGVTLLAHGYNGNINGWVRKAADDITARAGGSANVTQYVLKVARNRSNQLDVIDYARASGFETPDKTAAAEIIIKLDWSTVSDGSFSTGAVAHVVAGFMLAQIADGVRLAELPLHLIGHSRGASLVTALSHELGRAGVWVDQQTNLDPHPVDGVNDLLNANFGDAPMRTYDNVAFADNYWRSDGDTQNLDFDGEPVAGAHNVNLNSTVQANFTGSAHASVTSYYDGTINLTASNGGDTPIFDSWYGSSASKPGRDQTGFLFSRLVGGPRPADGLWTASSGTAGRTLAGQSGAQWYNAADLRVIGGRAFAAGSGITVRFIRQDRDGGGHIDVLLDRDTNPFNNNFVRTMWRQNLGESDQITPTRMRGASAGADPRRYWIAARISDRSGHVRYAYSRSITLVTRSVAGSRSAFFRDQFFAKPQADVSTDLLA